SDVPRRQSRAEPECPRREQHVLDGGIDRGPRRASWTGDGSVLEAGDDPYRRLVVVIRQIFDSSVLATVFGSIRPRRRWPARVAWLDHLVEGLFVIDLHLLFDFRVLEHQKAPPLSIATAGRGLARQKNIADQLVWHRVRLQPPHSPCRVDDLEYVCSL